MAGPEAEKKETNQIDPNSEILNKKHATSVLPWDQITDIITNHMDEKEIEILSRKKENAYDAFDLEAMKKNNDSRMHQFDNVDRPIHYAAGSIECIDAIEAQLSAEEFRGYLKGNIIKYLWREKHKGGKESLKKAQWYLNKLLT